MVNPDLQRAKQQILDGPDSPGKRFLLGIQAEHKKRSMREAVAQAKTIPAEAARRTKTTATKQDIDRLMTPRELPAQEHAEMSDEEFFSKHPVEQDMWEAG